MTESEKEDITESQKKRRAYLKKPRDVGTGPVRIGKPIILDQDIYSLFWISTMHPDYIYYYDKIDPNEDEIRPEPTEKDNQAQS